MIINRRQLRIKVLQQLYAFDQTEEASLKIFEKNLDFSIEKMFDLYYYYLLLMIELRNLAEQKIQEGKNKHVPSEKDLNPSLRFVNNRLIKSLSQNPVLTLRLQDRGISWSNEMDIVKGLFKKIRNEEFFIEYLESDDMSVERDIQFALQLFKKHIVNDDVLFAYIEDQSIFWIDDIDLVASMIVKSFKRSKDNLGQVEILDLFKEEKEEREFYHKLFHNSVMNKEETDGIIREFTNNWDIERIALMDILIMRLAVTEAIYFSSIPVKVTLNEYIELAKQYSTVKSNSFVNGILDKSFEELKKAGRIKKTGRGLIE
jgi:N utilization substance protein B